MAQIQIVQISNPDQPPTKAELLTMVERGDEFAAHIGGAFLRLFHHPGGAVLMASNGREGRSIKVADHPDQIGDVVDLFLSVTDQEGGE